MRAFQGAIGISPEQGLVSPDYLVLRPEPQVEGRFLHHLFRSHWFVGEMVSRLRGIGSTDQGNVRTPRINADDLGDIPIKLPSPKEQRAIADFLDAETARIDAIITRKRSMICLLAERIQAIRDVCFQSLAMRYGTVSLRRISSNIEQGWSPVCDGVPAQRTEWGVLKTSSVSSGRFEPTENKRLPSDVEPDVRWAVADGDLLLTRGSGSASMVGRPAVAKTEGRLLLVSDLLYRVRLVTATSDFVAEAMSASVARWQIEQSIRTDSGQTLKLRSDDVRNIAIPNVPLGEQVNVLINLNRKLMAVASLLVPLERQIGLLRERRQALITAVVTGEMEIPEGVVG